MTERSYLEWQIMSGREPIKVSSFVWFIVCRRTVCEQYAPGVSACRLLDTAEQKACVVSTAVVHCCLSFLGLVRALQLQMLPRMTDMRVKSVTDIKSAEKEISVILTWKLEARQSWTEKCATAAQNHTHTHACRALYAGRSRLSWFVFHYFSLWHLHALMHHRHAWKYWVLMYLHYTKRFCVWEHIESKV